MFKLKIVILFFVLLFPAIAFSACPNAYKDCRCTLAVNNGFGSVPDVDVVYCCKYGCGAMGFNGDSRCCIGAEQGKTWVDGSCKTPCSTVTCPSGQEKNGQTYKETTGTCCKTKTQTCSGNSVPAVNGSCNYGCIQPIQSHCHTVYENNRETLNCTGEQEFSPARCDHPYNSGYLTGSGWWTYSNGCCVCSGLGFGSAVESVNYGGRSVYVCVSAIPGDTNYTCSAGIRHFGIQYNDSGYYNAGVPSGISLGGAGGGTEQED